MRSQPPDVVESSAGGVFVRVHVQPRAGRSEIVGPHGDALKLRVSAPPVGGRASAAAADLLASALGVAPSAVEMRSGATSRVKRFFVTGLDAATVRELLGSYLGRSGSAPSTLR